MSRYLLGRVVELSTTTKVAGVLTDPTAITLTITKPDGSTSTPTPAHPGTGEYSYDYTPATVGRYSYRWVATGTAAGVDEEEFDVYASARNIIDADDLKDWLGITDADNDPQLIIAANAANSAVQIHCARSFEYTTVGAETARVFQVSDPYLVNIHDFHDATNLVVKTDDTDSGTFATTWSASDYQLEPLNGLDGPTPVPYWRIRAVANRRFPAARRRAALQVTAPWGWTAVPDGVFTGALIKASRLYKRKDSPEGVLGGVGDLGMVRITNREDPDVCALLRPYVRTDTRPLIG